MTAQADEHEGVVIGSAGAWIALTVSGEPKVSENPDFCDTPDFPALLKFEVGPFKGESSVELMGSPGRFGERFIDGLNRLAALDQRCGTSAWHWQRRWPFLVERRYEFPIAYLATLGGELHVEFKGVDQLGHINAMVAIRPAGRDQHDIKLSFQWNIDQSYLSNLISRTHREFPGL